MTDATETRHDTRMDRLERSNRILIVAVIALLAVNVFALLRPANDTAGGVQVLQRAHAASMEAYDNVNKKPKLVVTTSASGATLWIYELQKDGRYARSGFGQ